MRPGHKNAVTVKMEGLKKQRPLGRGLFCLVAAELVGLVGWIGELG